MITEKKKDFAIHIEIEIYLSSEKKLDFTKNDLHWHVIAPADYNTHLQERVVHGALLTSFPYFKLKFFSLVKQQVDLCASAPRDVFVTSWLTLGRLPFVNWELSAPPQRLQLKKKEYPRGARWEEGKGLSSSLSPSNRPLRAHSFFPLLSPPFNTKRKV